MAGIGHIEDGNLKSVRFLKSTIERNRTPTDRQYMCFVDGLQIIGISRHLKLAQQLWIRRIAQIDREQWVDPPIRYKIRPVTYKTHRIEQFTGRDPRNAADDV